MDAKLYSAVCHLSSTTGCNCPDLIAVVFADCIDDLPEETIDNAMEQAERLLDEASRHNALFGFNATLQRERERLYNYVENTLTA